MNDTPKTENHEWQKTETSATQRRILEEHDRALNLDELASDYLNASCDNELARIAFYRILSILAGCQVPPDLIRVTKEEKDQAQAEWVRNVNERKAGLREGPLTGPIEGTMTVYFPGVKMQDRTRAIVEAAEALEQALHERAEQHVVGRNAELADDLESSATCTADRCQIDPVLLGEADELLVTLLADDDHRASR